MFKTTKKSIQWGEETLTLETGKIARQADGCVIATYGETSVMAAMTNKMIEIIAVILIRPSLVNSFNSLRIMCTILTYIFEIHDIQVDGF